MKRLIAILFLLLLAVLLHAQDWDNRRTFRLQLTSDTVVFDSMSIVPGTVKLFTPDMFLINDTGYIIDYFAPAFISDSAFRQAHPEIILTCRVFSLNFTATARNKWADTLLRTDKPNEDWVVYKPVPVQNDFFGLGDLSSSGSISRGVSAGNNRDAVVSSSLNLQLNGKLTDNLNIAAAVTDNNIPVQPEGTTQQIQEFDQVYIQIYNSSLKLTAGDFAVSNAPGYFMKFNKKAQGGLFEAQFETRENKNPLKINTTFAGAVAKGRFARQTLNVTEGNQGPYKLKGNNNEIYIIILAGTERVFMDGKLMQRGQDYDYTMDYNTAEITFMPRHIITKDKRITVEFEYSDKNYARAMFYSGTEIKGKKFEVGIRFFSEQDLKNQPQNQELSDAQKQVLAMAGDSTASAFYRNFDTIPFNNNYVMYKMLDSTVAGITYDSVLVYSINADSAFYRPGFMNVGQGRGNYIQEQNVANGRVFRWVAPLNGVPQGAWEPVSLLIAPQKQQMFTFNALYKPAKTTVAFAELAVSNRDLNTFSDMHNADNSGMAIKAGVENAIKAGRDSSSVRQLKTSATHEWVMKNFSTIERFRDTEFERNWNVPAGAKTDEHISALKLVLTGKGTNSVAAGIAAYQRPGVFKGLQPTLGLSQQYGTVFLHGNALLTNASASSINSSFLKYNAGLGLRRKWFTVGLLTDAERNLFRTTTSDTLTAQSFGHELYEVYIQNPDTLQQSFRLFYRYRNDFYPNGHTFSLASRAEEAGISTSLTLNPRNRLGIYTALRRLYHVSPFLQQQGIKPDDNLVGRLEYTGRFMKDGLSLNTFYEVSSGLEVKNEYVFVEVPAGQGAYTWTDYNSNGIKELGEFEIAQYQDQATYIKVFVPTNNYVKAYSGQFNQMVNLNPALIWREAKGVRKFLTRFSEQFVFQLNSKNTGDRFLPELINPSQADTTLLTLNAIVKNTLSFNQQSPVFGLDYYMNDNRSRMLLVNGFDTRLLSSHSLKARWNVLRRFFFNATGITSLKAFESEYLQSRDYRLSIREVEPVAAYQPNSNVRFSLIFKYTEKSNLLGVLNEKTLINLYGTEFRYSRAQKGNITGRINYINIRYNEAANTPLAYEMLDALQPGSNITWNILYQKTLRNNMQLSIIYDGRKPGSEKIVHYGNVQIRAYF